MTDEPADRRRVAVAVLCIVGLLLLSLSVAALGIDEQSAVQSAVMAIFFASVFAAYRASQERRGESRSRRLGWILRAILLSATGVGLATTLALLLRPLVGANPFVREYGLLLGLVGAVVLLAAFRLGRSKPMPERQPAT
jgi:peptidoglycan/LPS O-acetylase OafA/YrhL